MRTVLTIAAVLAVAPGALAEPCRVVIVRAPDAVRVEIETWVAGESNCTRGLEVRAVETDDGRLYLFARDDRGFTRERVVPDATAAGVLIASWIADDSLAPALDLAVPPAPAIESVPEHTTPIVVDRGRNWRIFGIASMVTGGVLLGAGVFEGMRARAISNAITGHAPSEPWSPNIDEESARGERAEHLGTIMLVGAAALGATGIASYYIGRYRSNETIVVAPVASGSGATVGLVGRF